MKEAVKKGSVKDKGLGFDIGNPLQCIPYHSRRTVSTIKGRKRCDGKKGVPILTFTTFTMTTAIHVMTRSEVFIG